MIMPRETAFLRYVYICIHMYTYVHICIHMYIMINDNAARDCLFEKFSLVRVEGRKLLACRENTFYSKRTHSTAREHILQQENIFYRKRSQRKCVSHLPCQRAGRAQREHILKQENTFYQICTCRVSVLTELGNVAFYSKRTHSREHLL